MVLIEGIEYTGEFTWCEMCGCYILGDRNYLRVHIAYSHGHVEMYGCYLCMQGSERYTLFNLHCHQHISHHTSPFKVEPAVVVGVTKALDSLNVPPHGWPAAPTLPCTPGSEEWGSPAEIERSRYRMDYSQYRARQLCASPDESDESASTNIPLHIHSEVTHTHTVVTNTLRTLSPDEGSSGINEHTHTSGRGVKRPRGTPAGVLYRCIHATCGKVYYDRALYEAHTATHRRS